METLIGTNKEQFKLFYENEMNYQCKKKMRKLLNISLKKMSNQLKITK